MGIMMDKDSFHDRIMIGLAMAGLPFPEQICVAQEQHELPMTVEEIISLKLDISNSVAKKISSELTEIYLECMIDVSLDEDDLADEYGMRLHEEAHNKFLRYLRLNELKCSIVKKCKCVNVVIVDELMISIIVAKIVEHYSEGRTPVPCSRCNDIPEFSLAIRDSACDNNPFGSLSE
jgi:hypothetical protein